MPLDYKVLGQEAPAGTTDTDLYTVPADTQTIVSSLWATNRSGALITVRVAVRPAGAALANEHYLLYDAEVGANGAELLPAGITLGATDVVTVRASDGNATFQIFGSEITT